MSDQINSHPSSLLDQEQLQMLIEAGASESTELFREILGLFEEESSVKIVELRSFREIADYEGVGRAAHALAGSSANIGGKLVWQQAKEIEDLCKSGQGEEACRQLPELELAYEQTMAALKDYSAGLD